MILPRFIWLAPAKVFRDLNWTYQLTSWRNVKTCN